MVKTKEIHDSIIIYPKGRVDLHTNHNLAVDFDKITSKYAAHHYIINMKDVEYMSSSGLGLLMTIRRKLEVKDKHFILCELGTAVTKILKAVGMLESFTVFASENDALDSF